MDFPSLLNPAASGFLASHDSSRWKESCELTKKKNTLENWLHWWIIYTFNTWEKRRLLGMVIISYLIFCKTHLNNSLGIFNLIIRVLLILLPSQEVRGILAVSIAWCFSRQQPHFGIIFCYDLMMIKYTKLEL